MEIMAQAVEKTLHNEDRQTAIPALREMRDELREYLRAVEERLFWWDNLEDDFTPDTDPIIRVPNTMVRRLPDDDGVPAWDPDVG